MTWTYRDDGPWGVGVGRKLTVLEGDNNTYESQSRIIALENTIYDPRGVEDVTVVGPQWTMTLTDGTVLGPFVMPTTVLRPRGNWAPATSYSTLDLVIVPGSGLYLVLQDHTSIASFDPNYQLNGNDVYKLIINTSILSAVTILTGGSHTPTPIQAGNHFRCTNASGIVVTLPSDTTASIPIRSVYQWEQVAAGQVTFIPEGPGVIVNVPPTRDARSAEQFAVASAIKVAANEWTLAGYLAKKEE